MTLQFGLNAKYGLHETMKNDFISFSIEISIRADLCAYSNGFGEDLSSCQIIFADLIWLSLGDVWVECLKQTKCLWKNSWQRENR